MSDEKKDKGAGESVWQRFDRMRRRIFQEAASSYLSRGGESQHADMSHVRQSVRDAIQNPTPNVDENDDTEE